MGFGKRSRIAVGVLFALVVMLAVYVVRGRFHSRPSPTVAFSLHLPSSTGDAVIPLNVTGGTDGAQAFHIDVDLNHDGDFQGAGELAYAHGVLKDDGTGAGRLHGLVHGVYKVRARYTLANGEEVVTSDQTLAVLQAAAQPIPVSYEANQGQVSNAKVLFTGRTKNHVVHITAAETIIVSPKPQAEKRKLPAKMGDETWKKAYEPRPVQVQSFRLVGANPEAKPSADKKLPGVSNYIIGNKPENWRTNVEQYQAVISNGVYPNIDLVYHSNQGRLEYDFHVAPGGDPSRITFEFPDAKSVAVAEDGELVVRSAQGDSLRKGAPVMYQKNGAKLEAVKGDWIVTGPNQVGYVVAAYDTKRELVIDPILFSTYLNGTGFDNICAAKADAAGNLYVAGDTSSADFPTTSPLDGTLGGGKDVFITKINAAGTAIIYSTYLGGSANDGPTFGGLGIAVNAAGEVAITSETSSNDFPTVTPFQAAISIFNDVFVAKLNAAGSALVFSTYMGGRGFDFGNAIAFDGADNIYVCGNTNNGLFAPFFPTTPGAYQTTYGGGGLEGDAFVAKFTPVGALTYSTLLGGAADEEGQAIAVVGGNAYISGVTASADYPTTPGAFQTTFGGGGQDLFVAQVNATGSALVYSTYLGGTGWDGKDGLVFDAPLGLAVDAAGNAFVGSGTASTDYPTTASVLQTTLGGTTDAVLTKLNPTGAALVFSTYLGGTGDEIIYALTLDAAGNICVTGDTSSANFPLVSQLQAYVPSLANAFVSQFNPTGTSLLFSSPIGKGLDTGRGIALDASGNIWLAGRTVGANFPVVNPLMPAVGGFHSWIAKVAAVAPPPPPPPPPPTPGPSKKDEGDYQGSAGPGYGIGGEGGFGFGRSAPGANMRSPVLSVPLRDRAGKVHVFNVAHRQLTQSTEPAGTFSVAAWALLSGFMLAFLAMLAKLSRPA